LIRHSLRACCVIQMLNCHSHPSTRSPRQMYNPVLPMMVRPTQSALLSKYTRMDPLPGDLFLVRDLRKASVMRVPGHASLTSWGVLLFSATLRSSDVHPSVETPLYATKISGISTNLTPSMIVLSLLLHNPLQSAPKSCRYRHLFGPQPPPDRLLSLRAPRNEGYQRPLPASRKTMGNHRKSEDMSLTLSTRKAMKMRLRQRLGLMHLVKHLGRMCQEGVYANEEVGYDAYP
jgi:hypothetical protein